MTPKAQFDLALKLLADGRHAEGWPLYETRSAASVGIARPTLPFPEWQGEPNKRLVVWPEQGLGDKIMFARYIAQIDAADITVLCEPALERLFRANLPARVVAATGRTEFPDPDAWVFYGSLPYRLGLGAPSGEPYLQAPRRRAKGRIGVCTAGSPVHPNDHNRSLPPDVAKALLAIPGAISLHVDDTGARDFLETAGIIAGLERVITVDTAVAHLAGALGVPVWILLPAEGTDWRWGRYGETTPWYNSARLIRQRPGEPWSEVLSAVLT